MQHVHFFKCVSLNQRIMQLPHVTNLKRLPVQGWGARGGLGIRQTDGIQTQLRLALPHLRSWASQRAVSACGLAAEHEV